MHNILVVDDDEAIRDLLRETLCGLGYKVFSAVNGVDGLALLAQVDSVQVVLLDRNMPLMTGDEFLRIKNLDPNFSEISVIVISSSGDRISMPGAQHYLDKPFDMNELVEMLSDTTNRPPRARSHKREICASG